VSLTLADFERDALPTLMEYGTIECLSPAFNHQWATDGHLDTAIELLAHWARERSLGDAVIEVVRLEGRTPVLLVTLESSNGDDGTVVLYGHLDKQPPLGDWSDGLAPYSPVRRGDRLFARGLADDGYSTFSALLALEAVIATGEPHGRFVVLIEASEESGSPDLEPYLDHLTERLGRVELLICLDSGALTYDRLWVTTSLRGLASVNVTVEVLTRGQHSGSASGVVPSSFRVLRQLLDRVEDPLTGRIRLPQLHAPIPVASQRAALDLAEEFGEDVFADLPTVEGLRLMGSDVADRLLNQTWRPTLSVVGMKGIPEPELAGNVLRPSTTAVLSFRLPPTVNAKDAVHALRRVLTTDLPDGAHVVVTGEGANGWASPPMAPWLSRALDEASRAHFGHAPGYTGEGGTIPFLASLGERYPDVQFVATGVLGPHSNAHGIDEMLDLPTAVAVTNCVIDLLQKFSDRKDVA